MALKGDLVAAELGNLLQMTALNRRRGVLTVQDRGNPALRRRFRLDGDRLMPAEMPSAPSPALLVATGLLGYEAFQTAQKHAASFGGDPAGYLRAKGVLDDESEAAWRRAAVREELLEVFLWRELRFSVEDDDAVVPADRPAVHLDELVMEAARRQDEHERVRARLGEERPVLRRTGAEASDALSPIERLALEACDGVRGVREIGLAAGLPRFYAESAAASLLEAGVVEAIPVDELCEIGDRLFAEKRPHDALRVWRTALRSARLDLELHKRMANGLVETGRPAKACAHWRFVAGSLAAQGRRREALDQYHLAWKLLPARFKTLETIVGLLAEDPGPRTRDDRASLSDAKKLLAVFVDLGENERALALAERLRVVDPADREILTAAARLNSKLGRREAAAAAWLILADRLAEDGDLRRALETVRTVAAFDPANAKLYELRIADLTRRLADARRIRGRRRTRVAVAAAGALLAAWYAVYAWRAEKAILRVEALEAGSPAATEEATAAAAEVARWYRFAPAGARAEAKFRALSAEAQARREEKKAREDQAAAERILRKQETERRLGEGRRAVRAGRVADAAPFFRSAVAAAGGRGAPEAAAAETELAEIERYLAEAKALADEADRLEATDPDRAFELRVRLLKEYDGSAEAAGLELFVTVDTAPPGAWLIVDDGAAEGRAPLRTPVRLRGAIKVEARAEGCAPRTTTIPSPPPARVVRVALERTPSLTTDLGEPLVAASFVDERTAVAAARNGRVAAVDLASGAVRWRHAPESIESLRRAPVIAGGFAWCVAEDGRGKVLSLRDGSVVARTTTGPALVVAVHADAIWFADGPVLGRLGPDGAAVKVAELPEGRALGLVRGAGEWWIPAGEAGLWIADDAGNFRRVAEGPVTAVVPGLPGCARFVRPGRGVYTRDAAGACGVVLEVPDAVGLWAAGGSRALVRFGARGLALLDGDRVAVRTALPQDAAAADPVLDADGGRAAVALASGWLTVVDTATLETVAGRSCDPGARPALRGGVLLDPRETGRLSLVRER